MNLKEYYKNCLNELMEQEAPVDSVTKKREAIPVPLERSPELIRKDNEIAANKFKTSIGLYPTSSTKEGEEIKAKAKTADVDQRKANDEAGLYDVYKNLGRRR